MRSLSLLVVAVVCWPSGAFATSSALQELGGIAVHWASKQEAVKPISDEEMRNAAPLPLPEVQTQPTRSDRGASTPEAETEGYSYPAPFARYRLFPNSAYPKAPHGTVGKLFVKFGNTTVSCSAASIGNYAIWTAGHCIYDRDLQAFATEITFVPQYRSGSRPKGTWTGVVWITTQAWVSSGSHAGDFGFVILNPLNGKSIGQTVGGLGIAWGGSPQQSQWMVLGYPGQDPFNGETQIVCATSYAYDNALDPGTVGVGCDQTGGSSGGPWILSYRDGNFINGNVSYRSASKPLEMFSPFFGSAAKAFYDCAVSSTPSGPGPAC